VAKETAGQRFKRLREAAGLSQSQAAAASGVPVGTLRNWEYGRRTPTPDVAARYAATLGVSLDVLAGTAAEAPEPQAGAEAQGGRASGEKIKKPSKTKGRPAKGKDTEGTP
jgi:transcriptional regulator with XRE-family HTH domain